MSVFETHENVKRILQDSKNAFIYAGAGMSADLGIKTYWSGDDSLYGSAISKYGFTTLEHANASMWREHYEEQKKYTIDRLEENSRKLSESSDNAYTRLLKFLQENGKKYSVATSNTDNAFIHYGYSAQDLYEVHGNQRWLQCNEHRHGVFELNADFTCLACSRPARSNIFMFDDYGFQIDRETKQIYSYFDQNYEMEDRIDAGPPGMILEIGVGNTVSKIRNMARKQHKELGIPYIHVNSTEPNELEKELQNPNEIWLTMTAKEFSEDFLKM